MSTHPTTGGEGGTKRSESMWSDLPDDLLGTIRSRLICPRDRVRFKAVCKPWRVAASRQPLPPIAPLLLLSSLNSHNKKQHLCGPDNTWVFQVPGKLVNRRFVGSHDGGWVAALNMVNYTLSILNLFSGVDVPLPKVRTKTFSDIECHVTKIIFSGDPTSSNGCILAAIILGRLYITSCQVGYLDGRWTKCRSDEDCFLDIAFCNGELYCLTSPSGEVQLIKFEIGMEGESMPVVTAIQRLAIQRPTWYYDTYACNRYIFELHGKMSLAVRSKWLNNLDPFFKVFQLVDVDVDGAYNRRWVEMTHFGDYALFIGARRSMAVHVPVSGEHSGLKRNHMYYTRYTSRINKLPDDVVHSVTSDNGGQIKMYTKKDESIEDGVERTGYYVMGCNYAMWVQAPDL